MKRNSHKGWIEAYLETGKVNRQDEWTGSIAVGSRGFVKNVKVLLGVSAKGGNVIEEGERYQLREGQRTIRPFSRVKTMI